MAINWEKLEILPSQLEETLNFSFLDAWAIEITRVFLLRQKKYRKSLLLIEGCSFFLVYLLLFPIVLITLRNFNWLGNNTTGLILILSGTGIIAIAILILLNYYLWRKAKQLRVFAILLEKIDRYNELIDNFKLVAELNMVNFDLQNNSNRSPAEIELETAFYLTKKSLIKSIELEKIITRNPGNRAFSETDLASNRDRLLANLESGLVDLSSLSQNDRQDYYKLLSDAIDIGLSVHREMRKIQNLRQDNWES